MGQGIRTAVFVFFVSYYMGQPTWAPALFLLQYLFGILAGPIWHGVGNHAEIRRMLAARDAAGLISDPHREQILASKDQ